MTLLAYYILIGLITGCVIVGWYTCPRCPLDQEREELVGFATLWPLFWVLFLIWLVKQAARVPTDWFYRTA